jgi:lipopolysaccharide cholinephosphotransferase
MSGGIDTDTLRHVQLVQLDILKVIHSVCMENNIAYTLWGGTLLGAVRHKGFIPWDDDLDIALLRKDYEKLIALLKSTPIEGYYLHNMETDAHCVIPYAKYRAENTAYIETSLKDSKMRKGIFIDIFPLDKIKNPGSLESNMRRWVCKFIFHGIARKEKGRWERKGIKKAEILLSAVIGWFPKKTLSYIQKKLAFRENKKWNHRASIYSPNCKTERTYLSEDEFNHLTELEFENAQFCAIPHWDALLTRLYGNYTALPPEHKRTSGHGVEKVIL